MELSSKKHILWPLAFLLFNISRLSPFRQKRLWLFGAWEGMKYDDNSKYLFEYICEKHSNDIKAVWLTNKKQIAEEVNEKGYEAYSNQSLRGLWLQLRAGVVVYTNSLYDFGPTPLIGGAEVVTTWHGMSFKKIYNAKYTGAKLLAKKTMDRLFSWTYRNTSTVTSKQGQIWLTESFTLNANEIYITGQPRNDILKKVDRGAVLSDLKIPVDKKLILYLPTYRMPAMGCGAMEKIIRGMYDSIELDDALSKGNFVLLAKPHPLTPHINIEPRENFRILDYLFVKNNQELLGAGDVLITDFSGTFIDFALLNRPVIFYEPDEKEFLKHSEKIDRKFFDLCSLNKAVTPRELADKILHPSTAACQAINEVWEDKSITGTCYSENVYNVIRRKVGI